MIGFALIVAVLLLTSSLSVHPIGGEKIDVIIDFGDKKDIIRSVIDVEVLDAEVEDLATARISPYYVWLLRKVGAEVYRPRILRPMLDLSTLDIGVNIVANITGVNVERIDGRGVLVALVDTGVDYTHPAFKSQDGGNRILYIWDQTLDGRHPEGFGYGHECLPDEVADGSCPQQDTVGHGTIVASIVAGGVYGEWRLRGVAPGAELIVVKSGRPVCNGERWLFDEKGLIDGISYAVDKARLLGRRLIVVLSLGTSIGGHDGSSPLERALDRWADEGVVFVVAAGNSASDGRHVTGVLTRGRNTTLQWIVPPETSKAVISLIFGREDNVTLYITTPKNTTATVSFNKISNVDGFSVEASLWRRDDVKEALIEISDGENMPGLWRMVISAMDVGSGIWHAWIETDTCSNERESFLAGLDYTISPSSTVTIPGTARKVLTVGAYTTRTRWQAGGNTWSVGGVVGDLEYYSGRGPTIDGRTKPDLTAPGGVIIAARSKDTDRQPYSPNSLAAVSRGTSLSAPHAAGVAALVLQLAPHLSVEEVFEVLKSNAKVDDYTGAIPSTGSNSWGWGKLNAEIAYAVNITVVGKVEEAKPTVNINGAKLVTLYQKTSFNVVLAKNIPYNITLSLSQADGVIFQAIPSSYTPTYTQPKVLFNVYAVYRLRILHPNGLLLKEWWGREDSLISLGGLLENTGLEDVIKGYRLDNGREYFGRELTLSRPMDIVLILSENGSTYISVNVMGGLLAISLATALFILLWNVRRRQLKH